MLFTYRKYKCDQKRKLNKTREGTKKRTGSEYPYMFSCCNGIYVMNNMKYRHDNHYNHRKKTIRKKRMEKGKKIKFPSRFRDVIFCVNYCYYYFDFLNDREKIQTDQIRRLSIDLSSNKKKRKLISQTTTTKAAAIMHNCGWITIFLLLFFITFVQH